MNVEILNKYSAQPFTTILEIKCNYSPLPHDEYLSCPNNIVDGYEPRSIPNRRRSQQFKIIECKNAILTGYRSIIKDGILLNDALLADVIDPTALKQKLLKGIQEDLDISITSAGVEIEVERRPQVSIDHPVVVLGSDEPTNYGSCLYRIIPKLINHIDPDIPVLLPIDHGHWMRTLFESILGKGKFNYMHQRTKAVYNIRTAYVPSLRNHGVYFDDATIEFYRERAARIQNRSPYEKIYLSRQYSARNKPHVRKIVNERQFIEQLEKIGFKAIEIETFPIEDQIKFIRDAKIIVAPGGSGLFGCVFARSAEFVLDCEPGRTWVHAHHSLLKSCRIPHSICYGTRADPLSPHSSWEINIDAAMKVFS